MSDEIDAITMAKDAGIDPKRFRAALRAAHIDWHLHGARWLVKRGSAEHEDMKRVLATLSPWKRAR